MPGIHGVTIMKIIAMDISNQGGTDGVVTFRIHEEHMLVL
jgi:hypothetical protein